MSGDLEIVPVGHAEPSDVALVEAQYTYLPSHLMRDLASELKVVVCWDNVVDADARLDGKRPEGWPKGLTWNDVPGAFLVDRREVAVATITAGEGRRHVPLRGQGHGSWSLAIHELLHGFDHVRHTLSSSSGFNDAWKQDKDVIAREKGSEYFLNAHWGKRESFAESGARQFGTSVSGAPVWPELTRFWNALTTEQLRREPSGDTDIAGFDNRLFIGTAYRDAKGALVVKLVAREVGLAEGHGEYVLTPESRLHAVIGENLASEHIVRFDTDGQQRTEYLIRPFK